MHLQRLHRAIVEKTATIGVIGLGYVGLPVACAFADAGFQVLGLDLKEKRVRQINQGQNPIAGEEPGLDKLLARAVGSGRLRATTDYGAIADAQIVLIDVETPVDVNHVPHYMALRAACRSLGPVLADGTLVIVESTVAPGTAEGVVRPLLEECSGLRMNQGFFLGVCPERVMPGKLLRNLQTMSRVCGGSTPEVAEVMVALYRLVVAAELDASNMVTAEMVKTTENAYRDVQIAFANEVALISEAVGADVWEVRELVNKVPSRQMHRPGAGVGGHCIPKDPWLLAHGAGDRAPVRLIPAARAVNDYMPQHVVRLTLDGLHEAGVDPTDARVAVLGYAYLENSDDTRNSPSELYVDRMRELGIEVVVHDPWVHPYAGDLLGRVEGCDVAVLMVAHDIYGEVALSDLANALRTQVLVDGRNLFDRERAEQVGLIYRGVGQGKKP